MLIKKLRRKFVAVTMILVSVTVGISFAVDEYWTRLFEEEKKTALMEFWGGNDCPDYIDKKELLDMFYENYDDYKPLTDILVIACEFLVLFLISLFLSRFVTEPAEKALEREKQFISDASHELKTPLAAISINAQALQAEIGNDRHIRHILSESQANGCPRPKTAQTFLYRGSWKKNRNGKILAFKGGRRNGTHF